MLVKNLPDGPLDIVGDVHGELDALKQLLEVMGYSVDGVHPEGRKLVFVGDLTEDRTAQALSTLSTNW